MSFRYPGQFSNTQGAPGPGLGFGPGGAMPPALVAQPPSGMERLGTLAMGYGQGPMAQALAGQRALADQGRIDAAMGQRPATVQQALAMGAGLQAAPLAAGMRDAAKDHGTLQAGRLRTLQSLLEAGSADTQRQAGNVRRRAALRDRLFGRGVTAHDREIKARMSRDMERAARPSRGGFFRSLFGG